MNENDQQGGPSANPNNIDARLSESFPAPTGTSNTAAQDKRAVAKQKLIAAKESYEQAYNALKEALGPDSNLVERFDSNREKLALTTPGDAKPMMAVLQAGEQKSLANLPEPIRTASQAEALARYQQAQNNYIDAALGKHHAALYSKASAAGFSAADPTKQITPLATAPTPKVNPQQGTEELEADAEEDDQPIKGIGEHPPGTDPLDHLEHLKDQKEIIWTNEKGETSQINVDGDNASSDDPEALAKYVAAKGYTQFEIDKGKPEDVLRAMQAMEKEGVPNVTLAGEAKAKMDKLVKKDPDSDIAQEYGRLQASFKASSEAYNKPGAFQDAPHLKEQPIQPEAAAAAAASPSVSPSPPASAPTPSAVKSAAAAAAPAPEAPESLTAGVNNMMANLKPGVANSVIKYLANNISQGIKNDKSASPSTLKALEGFIDLRMNALDNKQNKLEDKIIKLENAIQREKQNLPDNTKVNEKTDNLQKKITALRDNKNDLENEKGELNKVIPRLDTEKKEHDEKNNKTRSHIRM